MHGVTLPVGLFDWIIPLPLLETSIARRFIPRILLPLYNPGRATIAPPGAFVGGLLALAQLAIACYANHRLGKEVTCSPPPMPAITVAVHLLHW